MSALSQTRTDLATVLAGVTVTVPGVGSPVTVPTVAVVPPGATPPLLMTGPADPYIDFTDVNFDEKRVNLVAVAVAAGVNDTGAEQIDDMVTACLVKLLAFDSGFEVDQVDRPGQITLNGQSYLGTVIRVSRTVPLNA